MIIHISGFPGSGKTTLGKKLHSMMRNIVVHDTDEFIQHHTKEGKQLLKLAADQKFKEYRILWKATLESKISEFVAAHPNRIIVFVGSLDNFSWSTPYNIKANYKFMLDVPMNELMKRYYLRISHKPSKEYWDKLAKGTYRISGSEDIIKSSASYNKWHREHGYSAMTDMQIIKAIKKIASVD
jgi:adenylate kinase family enzyme